jgi:FtsH-binding integral membrane protein
MLLEKVAGARCADSQSSSRKGTEFMSQMYNDPYARGYGDYQSAAAAEQNERVTFIRRTYGHLAGAVLAFVALEMWFFAITNPEQRTAAVVGMFGNPISLLVLFGLFIGGGFLAQWWATNSTSRGMQYAGLGLYVLLQAIIFAPILVYAADYVQKMDPNSHLIETAGILTGVVFGGLTLGVFVTKKDFSFLGGFLWIAGFLVMGIILCAIIFQFPLGMWFSAALIGLACCYILYDTSNVLHHYRTDQYVGAALALFASVALLFYYILRLLIQSRNN